MTTELLNVGDVVVSKFGNRWVVEAWQKSADGPLYVLRNRPPEMPEAHGTTYSGPLPAWVERVHRRDVTCEHGVAMDVHCCGCHSGFLFDSSTCVCF